MSPSRTFLLLASVTLSSPALAQGLCETPYTNDDLERDVAEANKRLNDVDMNGALELVTEAGRQLRCLPTPVDPKALARFARTMSVLGFYGQDEFAAIRYGLMQRAAYPDLPYDDSLPEGHPYRDLMEMTDDPISGSASEALVVPRNGRFLMNGHEVEGASAWAEVPQFVQVVDKEGVVLDAYWQDGAAFPPRWIGAGGGAPSAGGGGGGLPLPDGPGLAVTGGGAGLMVVSGLLYVGAAMSAKGMKDASTPEELVQVRTRTNLLVVGSAAALVGGVGLGAAGFFIEDGAGVSLHVRF